MTDRLVDAGAGAPGVARRERRVGASWWAAVLAVLLTAGLLPAAVQAASSASNGRGYEMVSPPNKNGGEVVGQGTAVIAADDGNALVFNARSVFADAPGSGGAGFTQYVARRGGDGWTTRGAAPPGASSALQTLGGGTYVYAFSPDLRRAVLSSYDLPGATDDAAKLLNIYFEDVESRQVTTASVTHADPLATVEGDWDNYNFGVDRDARRTLFTSTSRLLPEAPPSGTQSVYESHDGQLSLASVLPDGSSAEGAEVGVGGSRSYRGNLSADGTRAVFTAPIDGERQIFLRIDGSRTVRVSESEATTPVATPTTVLFNGMTPDGRQAFFTTTSRLVDEDTNDGSDLYRWTDSADPDHDANLTMITHNGDALPLALIGMSDDGRRVYHNANSGNGIYLWNDGITRLVDPSADANEGSGMTLTDSARASERTLPGWSRVSPDGRYLAFDLIARTGSATSQFFGPLRVYDAQTGVLHTVTDNATIVPTISQVSPSPFLGGNRPRFLTGDGRVFFSTPRSLVDEDINGALDVYEYDIASGQVGLLSPGTGGPSSFVTASVDGDDVFFVTRDQLTSEDTDQGADFYDARVGGGFARASVHTGPACVGDTCRSAHSGAPAGLEPGSQTTQRGEPTVPARSPRLTLSGARTVRGLRLRVSLAASVAGRVAWSGSGLVTGHRQLAAEHPTTVGVVLSAAGRRVLRQRGVLRTRLRVTLTTATGQKKSLAVAVKFLNPTSAKGR